jgi:excisionase family DNA binding protein
MTATYPASIDSLLRSILRDAIRDVLREELAHAAASMPRAEPAGPDRYLSVKAAAAMMSVSTGSVRSWISAGDVRACRAGRQLRVRECDVHAYMARRPAGSEEVSVEDEVQRILSQEAHRCATCGHLPSTHDRGRRCRVRKCNCSCWTPKK